MDNTETVDKTKVKLLYLGFLSLSLVLSESKEFKSIQGADQGKNNWIVFRNDYTFLYRDLKGLARILFQRDLLNPDTYKLVDGYISQMHTLRNPYFDDDFFKGKLELRKAWMEKCLLETRLIMDKYGIEIPELNKG